MLFTELIVDNNLVGFDFELFGNEHIFRGPIKEIRIEGNKAIIELAKCAHRQINGNIWVQSSINNFYFNAVQKVFQTVTKNIYTFSVWQEKDAQIYAEKNSNLDFNLVMKTNPE